MYIAYQSSNEFAKHTGISIYSLLKNNKDLDITIVLLNNGIFDEEINKIKSIVYSFGKNIVIIDLKQKIKEIVQEYSLEKYKNVTSIAQILPTCIYPNYMKKVLLIDSDTIVLGNLSEIEPIDFERYILSAVPNYIYKCVEVEDESKKVINQNGIYYNAGVVLYNLENWKKNNCNEMIIKQLNADLDTENYFAVQNILNLAIPIDKVYMMNYKYNYFGFIYNSKLRKNIHAFYPEANDTEKEPIIIHYKGFYERPWFKQVRGKYASKYREYKKETPWKDEPLENIYINQKFKELSVISKIRIIVKNLFR